MMIKIAMTITVLTALLASANAQAVVVHDALSTTDRPVAECSAAQVDPFLLLAGKSAGTPMQASNQSIDMSDDEYNSSYIFGMTKGVANSTLTPAFKPLVFLLTVPLDIALLPFAAIGGYF